jgi:hypothetical protein
VKSSVKPDNLVHVVLDEPQNLKSRIAVVAIRI